MSYKASQSSSEKRISAEEEARMLHETYTFDLTSTKRPTESTTIIEGETFRKAREHANAAREIGEKPTKQLVEVDPVTRTPIAEPFPDSTPNSDN
ncbi:MAG TPA: hypothetical protein VLF90_03930 [Patescibacteria group bacterium]|nr:hypothetical protein [Patescibacteria group bacterium]